MSPAAVPLDLDDLRMTVRDVFTVTDQGVIMTGLVEGGPVAVKDVVCLRPAEGEWRELTVDGIVQLRGGREELDAAEPGMIVGLRFEGIEKKDANVGDELTADCD
jgi:GTPase